MSSKSLCEKDVYIILISACLILLNCSCEMATTTNGSSTELLSVEVVDENGKVMGRLEENETGDHLFLCLLGEEPTEFGKCGDVVEPEASALNDNIMAAVYVRNCGATTDFATRVDVISNGNDIGKDDGNTVFILKGDQQVSVQWKDSNTLVVNYPIAQDGYIYKQTKECGNCKIEYCETNKNATKSRYLEYSNVNYGVAGISVTGLSEDIILRKAGWDQEKSGMTRKEWGHWYGQPPYGDDPREQELIKQGIIIGNQIKQDKTD